nr:putative ribonuclease H-like domain-containing protein [Tanacetum cinerariifolium]
DKDLQESKDPQVVSDPDTTWGLTILFLVHGNPQHALKDKGVIDSGCSRHMTGNMSNLSNFKELNGRYVAFGDNLKGGKISGKEKAREDSVQQYVLFPVWSSGSTNPQNADDDAAFGSKKPEFEGRKPESEVHVSPSSSAQTKKLDNKNKREAKGKSPVESSTGYRNLSAEFKDFSDNSNNEVNAAGSLVLAVGQIFTNSTNTFSATGPSNTAVSPTHGKSSYVDTSQLPNYPNMPELEDITYSDDEEDIEAMQEELLQFKMQKVWVLVDFPHGKRAIEEGIDYEEVFAPVARIEAIRLFLAYASFMGFMVYQMNVKSAFLYGTIEEEVYVYQPTGFEDLDYPNKVYKVVKAIYGLHQAPRAWYETLANYLLENNFQRGKIDHTLFIKRQKGDILLVHIYVDDIIFGSTNKDLCKAFEKLMKDKFQMSSMGELTFFLGLQVKQKQDGIFVSQDKYVAEILRKFSLTDRKSVSILIDTEKPLLKDLDGEDVNVHTYRSMIGSLMYLTSSRADIMFAVCACARFQVTPKGLHLHAVKRIFRYLKGKPHLGLWYPKDSPFNFVAYSDTDYAGASLDRKSTTGRCHILGCRLISWQCKKQTVMATSSIEADLVRNVDSSTKFYMYPRFLQLMIRAQVGDLSSHSTKYSSFALTQKVFANMRRVGKGFSGVDTSLFEGMIVAQQVNVDDVPAAGVADEGAADVNVDDVLTVVDEPTIPLPPPTTQPLQPSQDLPSTSQVQPSPSLSPIAQPPSPQQQLQPSHDAEISMDLLHTLLETCTTLTRRVKHLEHNKIAQALEITKLKQRVKKLERRNKLKVSKLRRLKKVGTSQRVDTSDDTIKDDVSKQGGIIANIYADVDVTLKDVADIAKEVDVDAEIEKSADVQGRQAESQAQIYQIDLEHADKVLSMQDDEIKPIELQEVVEVVTTAKLIT